MTTITYRDVSIDTEATLVNTGVVVGSETRTSTDTVDNSQAVEAAEGRVDTAVAAQAEARGVVEEADLPWANGKQAREAEAAVDGIDPAVQAELDANQALLDFHVDGRDSDVEVEAYDALNEDYDTAFDALVEARADLHTAETVAGGAIDEVQLDVALDLFADRHAANQEEAAAQEALEATPDTVTTTSSYNVVIRDFSFDANADTVYTAIDELLDNGGTSSISLRDFEAATGLDDVLVYDSEDGQVQFASTVNGMDIRDFDMDTFRSDEGLDTVTAYKFVDTVTGEEYIDGKVYLKDDTHNQADGSVMWNLASGKYTVEELEALTGVDINEAAGDYDHNGTIDLVDYAAYIRTTHTSASADGDIAVHLINDADSSDFSVLGSHFASGNTSDNTSIGGESYTAIVMGDLVDVTVADMVDFNGSIKGYDYLGDFDFVAIEDTATIM